MSDPDLIVYDTLSEYEEDESPHYYRPRDSIPEYPDLACVNAVQVLINRLGEASHDETRVVVGGEYVLNPDRLDVERLLNTLVDLNILEEVEHVDANSV